MTDLINFTQFRAEISDIDGVLATVGRYTDGIKTGDIDLVRTAFRPDAAMFGYDHDALSAGSIDNLYIWLRENQAEPGQKPGVLRTHVDILDITPSTAVVKITLEYDFPDTDPVRTQYTTDHHCLVKADGQWIIAAKLFHWYNY